MIRHAQQICANLNVAIIALLNQTEDEDSLLGIAEANAEAALSQIREAIRERQESAPAEVSE